MQYRLLVLGMCAATCVAQQTTTTPNIGLQIPAFNTPNWQVPYNYDWNLLDKIFGGQIVVPSLSVTTLIAPNFVVSQGSVISGLGFTPLNPSQNLNDVANKATALSNIGGIGAGSYQGVWSSGATYNSGQIVFYQGSSYISLQSLNTGNTPSSGSSSWGILVNGSGNSGGSSTGSAPAAVVFDMGADPRVYGADPTASAAQNLSAIQTAETSAAATGSGVVRLAGGVYQISSTLDIPPNIRLESSGGTNATIRLVSSATANTPVITMGTVAGTPHPSARLSNITIDCNGVTGAIGIQDNYGLEQSGGEHVKILNCNGNSLIVNGAGNTLTGSVQNDYGWHDVHMIPGTAAAVTTVPLVGLNLLDGGGFSDISIVATSGNPVHYGAVLSGANFNLDSIRVKGYTVASVLIGPPSSPIATQGGTGIHIRNAIASTNGTGPVVEIATGATNAANGIKIEGAAFESGATGCGTVQNDVTGECVTTPSYEVGGQSAGAPVITDLGYGNTWHLHNPITNDKEVTLQGISTQLDLVYKNGSTAFGWNMFANANGHLEIGHGGAEGAKDLIFDNPFRKFCVGADTTCSGLNMQGNISSPGNAILSGVGSDIYWDPTGANWVYPGDNSGFAGGMYMLNPGGINTPSNSGGIAVWSMNGLTNGQTMSQLAWNNAVRAIFPPSGGVLLLNGNGATCVRGTLTFVQDTSNQNDTLQWCGLASGSLGWQTGGSGGGGGGAATSIGGVPVGAASTPGQVLENVSGSITGATVSVIATAGGHGICIDGTGVPYRCENWRTVSGTTDTLGDTDCFNGVRYTSSSTVTVTVGAPGPLPTPPLRQNCPIDILVNPTSGSGGQINLTSSAKFGDTGGPTSVTAAVASGGTVGSPHGITVSNDGVYLQLQYKF